MNPKLKPEIKRRWVEALRSGRYLQARGRLCDNDEGALRYCCLGVLVDLAVKDGVGHWTRPDSWGITGWSPNFNLLNWLHALPGKETGHLPGQVIKWAFVERSGMASPHVTYGSQPRPLVPLTHINDHVRLGFDEIADLIEEQY